MVDPITRGGYPNPTYQAMRQDLASKKAFQDKHIYIRPNQDPTVVDTSKWGCGQFLCFLVGVTAIVSTILAIGCATDPCVSSSIGSEDKSVCQHTCEEKKIIAIITGIVFMCIAVLVCIRRKCIS